MTTLLTPRPARRPEPAPLFDLFTPTLPAPVLHGAYELLVPGNGERVLFAESLEHAAAQLVQALARTASPARQLALTTRYHALLRQAAHRGALAADGVGQLLCHTSDDGQVAYARVRGPQTRRAPLFSVGDTVYALPGTGVPGVLPTRGLRIDDVFVTGHPSADRQVVYVAGGHVLRQRQLTREQPVTALS